MMTQDLMMMLYMYSTTIKGLTIN